MRKKKTYRARSKPEKGKRSRPWAQDSDVLARLEQVEELHLASKNFREIARILEVSECTIRRDVKRLSAIWRDRLGAKREDMRAKRIAELENVKRRADRESETGENVVPALNLSRLAVMDAAKLEGLVQDRLAVGGDAGEPPVLTREMSEEELGAYYRKLKRGGGGSTSADAG